MSLTPRHLACLFLTLLGPIIGILTSPSPSAAQGETTTVTCYKGNPANDKIIGTVDVTFAKNANSSCTSTYYDKCQGECIACYTDRESGKMVCYDNKGGKSLFLPPFTAR